MKKTIILILLPLLGIAGTSFFGIVPGSLGLDRMQNSSAGFARGGFELAFQDSFVVNYNNYATWPSLTRTMFLLNTEYNILTTETSTQNLTSSTANFQGGLIVMPLIKKSLSVGIGLRPVTSFDQRITSGEVGVGSNATETIWVKGNLNEASISAAYKITDRLSLAMSAIYNFGMIEDKYWLDYDETGYSDIKILNKYQYYGGSISLHGFYQINETMFSGIKLNFPTKLNLTVEQESLNSNFKPDEDRNMTLPFTLGLGYGYKFTERYYTGMDLYYTNWQNGYKIDDQSIDSYNDSWQLSLGIERMPNPRKFVGYGEKIHYRSGLYFGQKNVQAGGESLYEYGIAVGAGLPLVSEFRRIDLSLLYGKRGDLETNFASESFIKLNISITASEKWFVREEN